MSVRKRAERKILHDYMAWLSEHHECVEPDRASGSMCEIYNTLNRGNNNLGFAKILMIAMFFISILVLMCLDRKEFLLQKSITRTKGVEKWFS